MKMTKILATVIGYCMLSGFSHTSAEMNIEEEIFTGRLEVKGPCAQRIVSIISPNANKAGVMHRWKDPLTKTAYEYTFVVKNFCDLRSLQEGETFTFRFSRAKVNNACPSCLMYRPVPDSERFITVLYKGGSPVPAHINHPQ
jgi:Cu/Ag efflux protein CusF